MWMARQRRPVAKARLRGIDRSSGAAMMFFDKVEFQWVRRGEQWLLEDFVAYWKGKPLNAVDSLKGKRVAPVPARRD